MRLQPWNIDFVANVGLHLTGLTSLVLDFEDVDFDYEFDTLPSFKPLTSLPALASLFVNTPADGEISQLTELFTMGLTSLKRLWLHIGHRDHGPRVDWEIDVEVSYGACVSRPRTQGRCFSRLLLVTGYCNLLKQFQGKRLCFFFLG
jgi:hypothetical protein